jgi:membrane protein required for colicin V production
MTLDMAWVDIGLLAFLTVSVGVGLMRGVVFELLSLAGWFAAYFGAQWGAPWAQQYVTLGGPGTALNHGIAFACVFVLVLIVWGLAARLVRSLIRATPLSPVDRLFGAGFGLLRGMVVLLVLAALIGITPLVRSVAWQQSQGAVWLAAALQELRPWISSEVSKFPSA